MNEKLTSQMLADALITQLQISRKSAETFVRTFFDVISEGLMEDGNVRIKGLGTFKLVEVNSRESVNVSTGERFVIPSFRKVSFTPEDAVSELITQVNQTSIPTETLPDEPTRPTDAAATHAAETETGVAQKMEEASIEAETITETAGHAQTSVVAEAPVDEFSGIDVVIATPESLEDYQQKLAAAAQKTNEAKAQLSDMQAQIAALQQRLAEAESEVESAAAEQDRFQQIVDNITENRLTARVAAPQEQALSAEHATAAYSAASVAAEVSSIATTAETISANPETAGKSEAVQDAATTAAGLSATAAEEATFAIATSAQVQPAEAEGDSSSANDTVQSVPSADAVASFASHQAEAPSKAAPTSPLADAALQPSEADVSLATQSHPHRHKRLVLALLAVLLVGIACVACYYFIIHPRLTQPTTISAPPSGTQPAASKSSSSRQSEQAGQVNRPSTAASQPTKPARTIPETYEVKKGESLTIISVKFYNTKDSTQAIIRANTLKDPNNVPYGTIIRLP